MKHFVKRYRSFLIVSVVLLLAGLFNKELGQQVLSTTAYQLKEMLLVIPPIFVLLGLLDIWVPKQTMVKYMGEGSGLKGILLALFIGSAAAGPLYGAFPVAAVFMRKGVKFSNILIFLGAWSTTKIPMILFEFSALGLPFGEKGDREHLYESDAKQLIDHNREADQTLKVQDAYHLLPDELDQALFLELNQLATERLAGQPKIISQPFPAQGKGYFKIRSVVTAVGLLEFKQQACNSEVGIPASHALHRRFKAAHPVRHRLDDLQCNRAVFFKQRCELRLAEDADVCLLQRLDRVGNPLFGKQKSCSVVVVCRKDV